MKGIEVYINEWPRFFQIGNNNQIAKKTLTNLKNEVASFNQAWHKSSLDGGNQYQLIYSYSRGDNNKIAKLYWRIFKIFFSRTTGPISTILGAKHPWVKMTQVLLLQVRNIQFWKKMMFFSLNQRYDIIISHSKYWFIDYSIFWNCFSGERCGSWAFCYFIHAEYWFGLFLMKNNLLFKSWPESFFLDPTHLSIIVTGSVSAKFGTKYFLLQRLGDRWSLMQWMIIRKFRFKYILLSVIFRKEGIKGEYLHKGGVGQVLYQMTFVEFYLWSIYWTNITLNISSNSNRMNVCNMSLSKL